MTSGRIPPDSRPAGPDSELLETICPYEAAELDAEALRAIGFYPTPDAVPPF